jgi:spermidine dehydrogenase
MDRAISRRDFVNGVGVALTGALFAGGAAGAAFGDAPAAPGAPADSGAPIVPGAPAASAPPGLDPYPPRRTGMRGSHPGSFEVAHHVRDTHSYDLSAAVDTGESYDLVIVGGGLSGLSAAHFFLKRVGGDARVLILDNHDDFGGHAKRNEFEYNGRLLALNGGTLNIESPLRYNAPAQEILRDIGIDLPRYQVANARNRKLYESLGLSEGYFFDRETWGHDRLLRGAAEDGRGFAPGFLAQSPLSAAAKRDLQRLYDPRQPDYLPGVSEADKKLQLARMSYRDYLLKVAKVDPSLLWFFARATEGWYCVGPDAVPALFAWNDGLPGFDGLGLQAPPPGTLEDLPGGQHGRQRMEGGGGEIHFPDGNATIARLLVRSLIPDAVPGNTMEDVGAARVDYALLDRDNQRARIRLGSAVVQVEHDGDPAHARAVKLAYVRDGKAYRVTGGACVMACWNMFIPYIVPSLPAAQKEALSYNVKRPIVYTSVAIKNWRSFHKLGVSHINTPGMYHSEVSLAEAVSLGDLKHPQSPDEPVVVHMERTPCSAGQPIRMQHRLGRAELLATSFETFERNIRDQLNRVLGPGGFNAAEEIIAITVNRWPHGYTYSYNSLYDPLEWVFTSSPARPNVAARQPFGLISIANADAAASPHTDAAILEAHRAVIEVLDRRAMPILG